MSRGIGPSGQPLPPGGHRTRSPPRNKPDDGRFVRLERLASILRSAPSNCSPFPFLFFFLSLSHFFLFTRSESAGTRRGSRLPPETPRFAIFSRRIRGKRNFQLRQVLSRPTLLSVSLAGYYRFCRGSQLTRLLIRACPRGVLISIERLLSRLGNFYRE